MNQSQNTSGPSTAPYLAGAVVLAVIAIVAFHFMDFHFVVAGGGR